MKNICRKIIWLFLFCASFIYSQESVMADLKINVDGSINVLEKITDFSVTDTLLLHKNIPLNKNNEEILKDKMHLYRNNYLYYFKSDGKLNYSLSLPKQHYDSFFYKDSVFFIAENYLALNKGTFNSRKKIDLNIILPPNLKLIYPTKENSSNTFYTAPAIIAGNFKDELVNGYTVYQRPAVVGNQKRLKEIIKTIDDTFVYFQNVFSIRNEKPEIVFMPFEGKLAGKNIDNVLILNENFLKNEYFNKRILIHEILHLWWGDNSIRFENPVLTEAFTEFFTLNYLKASGEVNYLNQLITAKRTSANEIKVYDLTFNKIKDEKIYNIYCYDLLPLLIYSNKKADTILIDFYNLNQNSFISNAKGDVLLKSLSVKIQGENHKE